MAPSSGSIRRRQLPDTAQSSVSRSRSDADNHQQPLNNHRLKKKRFSLRDHFLRTNVDIYFLCVFFAMIKGWELQKQVVEASSDASCTLLQNGFLHVSAESVYDEKVLTNVTTETLDKIRNKYNIMVKREVYSILFPVFCQLMAIFIYYGLSRYLSFMPYTAIVFLMGVGIGYECDWTGTQNAVFVAAQDWLAMNGQVVLLLFLPGLIFLEAVTINVHLFFQAFWQLMILAFPMVLFGTGLTGLVAKLMLPYGWDWNLSMTFGTILSSTDPVAVAGIFNALGAPPRMQMHIGGESLLNDGSSVLLYNIFSQRFFYQFGLPEFPTELGWGKGFAMFFRLTFGGGLIGLAFGLGTVFMLKFLNRRLSDEENVVQVILTVTVAYMAYFVADVLSGCSGIIATICCGLTVKVLGATLIHDVGLMLNFWGVLGEILNTLLFVLGGALWGNIISPATGLFQTNRAGTKITPTAVGYLLMLYALLMVIRFILVFGCYPIISRIGIGSSWREAIFMSFGGFRGTVGIALALSLDAQVFQYTNAVNCTLGPSQCDSYRYQANQVFGFVGGISILTLLVNGLLSGPLLKWLKLAKSEKTREKVVESYWKNMVENVLVDYMRLLSQERFKEVDFSLVREHVPFIGGITFRELMAAADVHKRNTPPHLYSPPHLEHVIPYVCQVEQQRRRRSVFMEHGYLLESFGTKMDTLTTSDTMEIPSSPQSVYSTESSGQTVQQRRVSQTKILTRCDKDIFDPEDIIETVRDIIMDEERLNFIEILRRCYYDQISNGELDKSSDLQYSLFQGLEFCEESAAKGQPLNDWNATKVASATNVVVCNRFFILALIKMKLVLSRWRQAFKEIWKRKKKCCCEVSASDEKSKSTFLQRLSANRELFLLDKLSFSVRQSLAFQNAHRDAQRVFVEEFASYPLTPAEEKVIEESKEQVMLAEADLDKIDAHDVQLIKGHLICLILLNKAVKYVAKLSRQCLIPEKDAIGMLDLLQGYRERMMLCRRLFHQGIMDMSQQSEFLRRLPSHRIDELNLSPVIETMSKTGVAVVPPYVKTFQVDSKIDNEIGDDKNDASTEVEAGGLTTSLPGNSDKSSLFSSLCSRNSL